MTRRVFSFLVSGLGTIAGGRLPAAWRDSFCQHELYHCVANDARIFRHDSGEIAMERSRAYLHCPNCGAVRISEQLNFPLVKVEINTTDWLAVDDRTSAKFEREPVGTAHELASNWRWSTEIFRAT